MKNKMAWLAVVPMALFSGCPLNAEPIEAFGPEGVLGACLTSQGSFRTPTACKVFSAIQTVGSFRSNYSEKITILLPNETAMQKHLEALGMSTEQFSKTSEAFAFAKQHVFKDILQPNESSQNMAGRAYFFSGQATALMVNGLTVLPLTEVGGVGFATIQEILP